MRDIDPLIQDAVRLLDTQLDSVSFQLLPDDDAMYAWVSGRGGGAVIVGRDGGALYANSAIGFEAHVGEYRGGRRTPPESFQRT